MVMVLQRTTTHASFIPASFLCCQSRAWTPRKRAERKRSFVARTELLPRARSTDDAHAESDERTVWCPGAAGDHHTRIFRRVVFMPLKSDAPPRRPINQHRIEHDVSGRTCSLARAATVHERHDTTCKEEWLACFNLIITPRAALTPLSV